MCIAIVKARNIEFSHSSVSYGKGTVVIYFQFRKRQICGVINTFTCFMFLIPLATVPRYNYFWHICTYRQYIVLECYIMGKLVLDLMSKDMYVGIQSLTEN